jgi:hypothetical protein
LAAPAAPRIINAGMHLLYGSMNERKKPHLTLGIVTSCALADREIPDFVISVQEIGKFPDGY